jgi:hypothetical protein
MLFPHEVTDWSRDRQLALFLRLLHHLTIAARGVVYVSPLASDEQVARLNSLNELMHQLTAIALRLQQFDATTTGDATPFEVASNAVRKTNTMSAFTQALTTALRADRD